MVVGQSGEFGDLASFVRVGHCSFGQSRASSIKRASTFFQQPVFKNPPRDARMFFRLPGGRNLTGFWLLVTVVLLTLSSIDDEPVVRDISRGFQSLWSDIEMLQ